MMEKVSAKDSIIGWGLFFLVEMEKKNEKI
jgi:hypothetical protein